MQKKYMYAVLLFTIAVCLIGSIIGENIYDNDLEREVFAHTDIAFKRLEQVLKIKEPGEVAEIWAKGVKERNGKVQYAVMDKNLRKKYYQKFVDLNWVTGTSSPWIVDYKIDLINETPEENKFKIEFTYTDSTGAEGKYVSTITVKRYGDYWFISDISEQAS